MNLEALKDKLIHAATAYDRKEAKGKRYNEYALAQYFIRVDEVIADIEAGATIRAAILAAFSGTLCNAMLKAAGEPKAIDAWEGKAGWTYLPASKRA